MCVVDLSGYAAPMLKSDRTALKATQREDWEPELVQFVRRWDDVIRNTPFSTPQLWLAKHGTHANQDIGPTVETASENWMLEQCPIFACRFLIQRLALFHTGTKFWERPNIIQRVLDVALTKQLDFDRYLARSLACALDNSRRGSLHVDFDSAKARYLMFNRRIVIGPLFPSSKREPSFFQRLTKGAKSDRVARVAVSLAATHFLSEGCYPDLRNASPILGLPLVDGDFISARLTAPLSAKFEFAGNTVRSLGGWSAPDWLDDLSYDLVAPLTLQPLGQLPQQVPEWGRQRALRAVGMLPFLTDYAIKFEEFREVLPQVGFPEEFVRSGSILLLVPGDALLRKPFLEWDRERDDQHVVSALWDVPLDRVLWAEGFHNRNSIRQTGRPLDDWLKEA